MPTIGQQKNKKSVRVDSLSIIPGDSLSEKCLVLRGSLSEIHISREMPGTQEPMQQSEKTSHKRQRIGDEIE